MLESEFSLFSLAVMFKIFAVVVRENIVKNKLGAESYKDPVCRLVSV